jgi:hypothetical protein
MNTRQALERISRFGSTDTSECEGCAPRPAAMRSPMDKVILIAAITIMATTTLSHADNPSTENGTQADVTPAPSKAKGHHPAQRLARSPCAVAMRIAEAHRPSARKLAKPLATIGASNKACKAILKHLGKSERSVRPRKSRAFVRGKKIRQRNRSNGPCPRALRAARSVQDTDALTKLRTINGNLRRARATCRAVAKVLMGDTEVMRAYRLKQK